MIHKVETGAVKNNSQRWRLSPNQGTVNICPAGFQNYFVHIPFPPATFFLSGMVHCGCPTPINLIAVCWRGGGRQMTHVFSSSSSLRYSRSCTCGTSPAQPYIYLTSFLCQDPLCQAWGLMGLGGGEWTSYVRGMWVVAVARGLTVADSIFQRWPQQYLLSHVLF